jgi:hypothetical protein
VHVNSDAPAVTSSTSRYVGSSLEVLIGIGCACVHVFIGVIVRSW